MSTGARDPSGDTRPRRGDMRNRTAWIAECRAASCLGREDLGPAAASGTLTPRYEPRQGQGFREASRSMNSA